MRKYLIISLLLFLSVGLSQEEYNINDLVKMDNGLHTIKFSDEVISGKIYKYFSDDESSKKVYVGNIKYGRKEGKWVDFFRSTGGKWYEQNYSYGMLDGLEIWWYENGKKESYINRKNHKYHGEYTTWYKNGQIKTKKNLLDGNFDGLNQEFYEDGKKKSEWTFKNGEPTGLCIDWFDNGEKSSEKVFKDGDMISEKKWKLEWKIEGSSLIQETVLIKSE